MAKLSRTAKVSLMLGLSSTMFFIELIVGIVAGSITLVADSFHMLNDVLGMAIALWAIMMAKSEKTVPNNTYGWQRAEILGALTNGVLLLGLCLTIYIDSIERFINIEQVRNPKLVMLVGCVGLAFNLLGLMLFHEHGHGHSHGHAHSDTHAHVHDDEEEVVGEQGSLLSTGDHQTAYNAINYAEAAGSSSRMQSSAIDNRSIIGVPHPVYTHQAIINSAQQMIDGEFSDESSDIPGSRDASGKSSPQIVAARRKSHTKRRRSSSGGGECSGGSGGHLNMHGVWLHVFGDCITNVAVIISGLVIWKAEGSWRFYFDPAMSILINTLIVCITIPLVKSASFILLNGVPSNVDLEDLRRDLRAIPHVLNVHDLHVWQLSDTKNVASVHVLIDRPPSHQCIHNSNSSSDTNIAAKAGDHYIPMSTTTTATSTSVRLVSRNRSLNTLSTPGAVDMDCLYMDVASEVKHAMHRHGIHSTTIQPEFVVGQPVSVATANAQNGDSVSLVNTMEEASSAQQNGGNQGHEGSALSKVAIVPGSHNMQNNNNGKQTAIGPCLLACRDGGCLPSSCCPSEEPIKVVPGIIPENHQ
ncbi:cation efflux protein [Coemansia reversa NRRL 1564]|uniref:Cation efflux protein n=1 Tax=Coemansia reversa (strain ATCC 12441 / NRRL 1564) TaxID=763665 RepID=A0A2G5B259_COERN|nr:cation efflux protein [Coemansia reversa NRRL 1564]|eukprot:PIA13084.1 cation efflux protein [Coemansia reversa NRRL 1564]